MGLNDTDVTSVLSLEEYNKLSKRQKGIKLMKPTREIPCDCGDPVACWLDGLLDGQRIYCCDDCWAALKAAKNG